LSEKPKLPEKSERKVAIPEKKKLPISKLEKSSTALPMITPNEFWEGFNEYFEKFKKDFQNMMLPSAQALEKVLAAVPKNRAPLVDLQDRGKDYLLKAEMPGFKKDDIDIQVYEDAIEISAETGWKYDLKNEKYLCKERACESFYRMVQLPEEIKVDDVAADLKDGVLEVILQKKAPKLSKKIVLK
jgi:HSP20 family protein